MTATALILGILVTAGIGLYVVWAQERAREEDND